MNKCAKTSDKINSTTPEKQSEELKETLKTTVPDKQMSLNYKLQLTFVMFEKRCFKTRLTKSIKWQTSMNSFSRLGSKTTTIGQSHEIILKKLTQNNSTNPENQSKELKETLTTTEPDQQVSLNH